jgi:hypothetical protein
MKTSTVKVKNDARVVKEVEFHHADVGWLVEVEVKVKDKARAVKEVEFHYAKV